MNGTCCINLKGSFHFHGQKPKTFSNIQVSYPLFVQALSRTNCSHTSRPRDHGLDIVPQQWEQCVCAASHTTTALNCLLCCSLFRAFLLVLSRALFFLLHGARLNTRHNTCRLSHTYNTDIVHYIAVNLNAVNPRPRWSTTGTPRVFLSH